MAIQPIDLQTLFTQVDKVGKAQVNQKEVLHFQAAFQGDQIQKKTDEWSHSVNELQNTGDGTDKINDQNARRQGSGRHSGRDQNEEDTSESQDEEEPSFISDPALGKNIDISG
jgi:hypothetical protein